jgi:circadian clock protein KaiC
MSVVKKRGGDHEHSIREFRLTEGGIKLGPPLKQFSGVLSGTPQYHGDAAPLFDDDDAREA